MAAAALFAPTLVLTLVVTAGSALAQPQAPSDAPTLDSILSRFAALPGLEARFVEEKTMAMLAVPVRSEGQIYFAGNPARLMRRVTAPDPSQALIAGGELRMRSGGRTETISIAGTPVLRGCVDSFRAVLAGDRDSLNRFYEAELTPRPDAGAEAWEIRLVPRDRALRQFLRRITMRGHGVTIDEMIMLEENGDQTRTRFRDVNTHRRFSASEAGRIFAIR